MIPIFVGYDERESVAYHTFCQSVMDHASGPVSFIPLVNRHFAKFYNDKNNTGTNAFNRSRFLIPYLMKHTGWAIFADGDMVVKDDIYKLWDMREMDKAVMVAKHDYKTKFPVKYLGSENSDYPRKNWSSLILWNCNHFANRHLTPDVVEKVDSAHLHRFKWIDDNRIGEIPKEWNWLVSEYPKNEDARLLHYTIGTPCFNEYKNCDHAHEWHNAYKRMINVCQQSRPILSLKRR